MKRQALAARAFFAIMIATALLVPPAPRYAQAQTPQGAPLTPLVGHSLYNSRLPALGDMIAALPAQSNSSQVTVLPLRTLPKAENQSSVQAQAQTPVYPAAMPALSANFDGNYNISGYLPPDTNGDIGYDPATGKKYYFQTVNVSFVFWDVTDPAHPTAVTPITLNYNFWNGAGGLCETTNDGDPVALFDSLAHRWIFSQFAFTASYIGPYYQCIAISASADPLGAWYRYSFQMPDSDLNDYPKLGVWPDAYYMTDHQFLNGGNWDGAGVFAFDRAKMLAGQPATYLYFNLKDIDINLGGHLPADFTGLTPPPAGAPGLFMELDSGIPADNGVDYLRIWEFHADFITPTNSTFGSTTSGDWGHANYKLVVDPFSPLIGYVVPQKSTTVKLDAIGDRMMFRLSYQNLGSRQVLVGNQTVDAGSGRAGIRWFEVQNSGSGWNLRQEGTYAPNDGNSRWMGSIAADVQDNLALGFSISGSSQYPSIGYAGRLVNDNLGAMAQGEAVLIAGAGAQTYSSAPRWGDYSSMSIDPQDGCTFWYTNEYYPATSTSTWYTRIGSFRFPGCGLPTTGTLVGTITRSSNSQPLAGATVTAGTLSMTTGVDGKYSFALQAGSYNISVQEYGFALATATNVAVTSGGTTTQDFAMTTLNPAVLHGLVSDGNGHTYPLYARLDISAPGFSQTVFTNPVTGLYSANLLQNQAYTVNVSSQGLAGYLPQTMIEDTPAAPDVPLNFEMQVDATCTTPGYQMESNTCTLIPGGLATGLVTDLNTGAGLVGATLTLSTGAYTNSMATPFDPLVGDGLYFLFQPTVNNSTPETNSLGATMIGGYNLVTANVLYHPNAVVSQNFALPAGQITFTPTALEANLITGSTFISSVRVKNNGTASAYFSLQSLPLSQPAPGAFEPPQFLVEPPDQGEQDTADLGMPPAPVTSVLPGGEVLSSWPSRLSTAWGIAVDTSGRVWASSPAAGWGGVGDLLGYDSSGQPAGRAYPYTWGPVIGPADLAFDPHTGNLWALNLTGGDHCLYEISPQVGVTGKHLCPGGGGGLMNSPRGLAYDPATDTFYAGSWNDQSITQFSRYGTLLRSVYTGLAISGLAYNPDTKHLFVMVNAQDTRIYVLDTANNFAMVGSFSVGADLIGPFGGAGLEMACNGSLWLTDQSDGQVYQVTSGESTSLCSVQAAWLSTNPSSGTLAAGQYVDVQIIYDSIGLAASDYTCQLQVIDNTPYTSANVPVIMHVFSGIFYRFPFIAR